MSGNLDWWLHSDAGLLARIGIGSAIFAALAAWDLFRRGRSATRWREYLFLLAAAGAATIYGVINDFLASSISWEYFYFGKGLDQQLGPRVPPDMSALQWEACRVGFKATWSVGIIIGVTLLIANNPRAHRRQLGYRELARLPVGVLLISVAFAMAGGWMGHHGWLAWTSRDLQLIVRDNLFRPRRFMCVYGINLGGYVGGVLATIAAVIYVARKR